jgi:hypothetical protein
VHHLLVQYNMHPVFLHCPTTYPRVYSVGWTQCDGFEITWSSVKVFMQLNLCSNSGQMLGLFQTMALLHTKGTYTNVVFTYVGMLSALVSLTFWLHLLSRGLKPCQLT